MKASLFLKLVSDMRREQGAFFAKRRDYPIEAREHLIQAKALEKEVDALIREGKLEPDEPTAPKPTQDNLVVEEP